MIQKAEKAFRTISEAAEDLDVPQHVLRFWETKFVQVKPLKRGGNRRYYRPEDLNLLHAIKHQLYDEGHSIKEVQGLIRDQGLKDFVDAWLEEFAPLKPAEFEKAEEKPPVETVPEPEPETEEAETAAQEAPEAPEPEPEEIPEIPLKEDQSTIRVSRDLVKALVNDLKALRALIDRLPD